jgi:hypothetical protein
MSWLFSLVPGVGPVLSVLTATWSFVASPFGRVLAVAAVAFLGGWQAKAQLDEAASLRAVISKQRIDLTAAQETADTANAMVAQIAQHDARNQEIISDLQARLSQHPSVAPTGSPAGNDCTLDPAAVSGLRRLR